MCSFLGPYDRVIYAQELNGNLNDEWRELLLLVDLQLLDRVRVAGHGNNIIVSRDYILLMKYMCIW